MQRTLLILSLIVIAILLALLWFNQKQHSTEIKALKQATLDSSKVYAKTKAAIQAQIRTVEAENSAALERSVKLAIAYKLENSRLKAALNRAKTGRVDTLLSAEPQLRYFIAYYDSINLHQSMRIDTLEIEKRVAKQLCDAIIFKKNELIAVQEKEITYLYSEIDKRDKIIDKQNRKLRRQKRWIVLLGLANAAPRGGY